MKAPLVCLMLLGTLAACGNRPPPPQNAVSSVTRAPSDYHYIFVPPATAGAATGTPRIIEVDVNERAISAPGLVRVRIVTTSDVTTVVAKLMGREMAIPQVSAGLFSMSEQLPGGIPFFFKGKNYDVNVVATTADGRTASISVPIYLNR